MGISIRKRVPPKPIDSRQLASGTGLRYATLAAPTKTRITQQEPGSFEPISTNRLAPFYSAIRLPIPRHLHSVVLRRRDRVNLRRDAEGRVSNLNVCVSLVERLLSRRTRGRLWVEPGLCTEQGLEAVRRCLPGRFPLGQLTVPLESLVRPLADCAGFGVSHRSSAPRVALSRTRC